MGCQYFAPCEHGADSFTIDIPKVTFGRGCLQEAGARAAALGMTRVALFTDALLRNGPYVDTVTQSLKLVGIDVAVFSEIRIEADDDSVERAAAFIADGNINGVGSVGGGSTWMVGAGRAKRTPSSSARRTMSSSRRWRASRS